MLRRAQQQKQQGQQGPKEVSQRQRWSSTVKRLSLAEARELISASRLPPSAAPLKRWTALDLEHSENGLSDNSALSRETSPKGENLEQPYVAKTAGSVNRRSRTGPLHQILDELTASSSSSNILINQLGHEPDMKSTSTVSLDKTETSLFHVRTEEAQSPSPSLAFGSPSSHPPSLSSSAPIELPSPPPPQKPPPSLPPSSTSPLSKMHSSSQEQIPSLQRPPSPPPMDPPSPPPMDPPSPPPMDPPSPPPMDPPSPPPMDPPSPPPMDPSSPPQHPSPRPEEGSSSHEPSSSPQNDESEEQDDASPDSKQEKGGRRRAVKSMISVRIISAQNNI